MIQGVSVQIDKPLAKYDFARLMGFCLPYPDGHAYKRNGNITTVLVHPAHLYGAGLTLKKYGIEITKEQIAKLKAEVPTGDKQKMFFHIKVLEDGFDVVDNKTSHFIPFANIEIVINTIYEDLESNGTTVITPRRLWALLSDAYKLFPEINEAMEVVKQSNLDQTKKDYIISGLYKNKSSLFEGLRVNKKDGDKNSYYRNYWYPILILKKLELISQIPPNRELMFMPSMREISEIDWQKKAREMFR